MATYHCDQAYAFDVSATGACTTAFSTSAVTTVAETSGGSSDMTMEDAEPSGSACKQAQGLPTRQALCCICCCNCCHISLCSSPRQHKHAEGGNRPGGVKRLCVANSWSVLPMWKRMVKLLQPENSHHDLATSHTSIGCYASCAQQIACWLHQRSASRNASYQSGV